MLNKRGPKIYPCGTPKIKFLQELREAPILVRYFLPVKYLYTSCRGMQSKQYACIVAINGL